MADDKSNQGGNDRARVAGNEPYEVDYFAKKHGITRDEAQALIDRVGNDRAALDAAAEGAAKPAPTKRRAASSVSKPTPAKTRKPAAPKRAKPAPASPPAVAAAVEAVAAPIRKVARPVRRQVADVGEQIAATSKRGTDKAVDRVTKATASLRRGATAAGDAVQSATSGVLPMVGAAAAGLVTGLALNLGRKAVVQAPSALAGDWFEAVKVEHRMALALFDKLQATRDDEVAQRAVLLTQLKHALSKHAFTEENVLYPALRVRGDTADADKLNHDHGYVKQYLYDLENMDDASPAYLPKVAEFRAQIEEHIREEEETIFPPLHAALGEAGNAKVTALANKEGFKLA